MADAFPTGSEILSAFDAADTDAAGTVDRLLPLIYDELHAMAHRQLAREAEGHTLQTTALVHEAYLKLIEGSGVGRRGRSYFFAAAGRAMRQILVDHARRRNADKRGAGAAAVSLKDHHLAVDALADELLDLDQALARLAEIDPRCVRVVECRYFAGLDVEETAEALQVSPRTVKSDWAFARAWLYAELRQPSEPKSPES